MDKIDQQYLNEIVGGTESGEVDTQHDLKVHEENTTIEELEVQCVVIRARFCFCLHILEKGKAVPKMCSTCLLSLGSYD